MKPTQYLSVDDLQAQTSLPEATAKCGVRLELPAGGPQARLDCPFGCPGDHSGKREISVDTSNPQKVFACHAYGCQVRGNLLMLMHGWLTGSFPPGGKIRGAEFKRVRDVLVGKDDEADQVIINTQANDSLPPKPELKNLPLAASENEKARELVTLDEKFLRDVAHMPPAAASYIRRHPCLTPAMLTKWRSGVLPADGGVDKRAWSLRGQVIYPILSEDNQVLAWVSRDPQFEAKDQAFNAMTPDQRAKEKRPMKHRVPSDFHRGLELFGQQSSRLMESGYRETIAKYGIIVVEGFNDVIGLDTLGVPAVAIMSNIITEAQVAKIERFARRISAGKVTLLFDTDPEGDAGAKETLWKLAECGLDVRLGWSRALHGGRFANRQPETLTAQEWQEGILPKLVG